MFDYVARLTTRIIRIVRRATTLVTNVVTHNLRTTHHAQFACVQFTRNPDTTCVVLDGFSRENLGVVILLLTLSLVQNLY